MLVAPTPGRYRWVRYMNAIQWFSSKETALTLGRISNFIHLPAPESTNFENCISLFLRQSSIAQRRGWSNRPISQIPQCTSSISHNAQFRSETCAFLFWMVHCGIWNRWIARLMNWVNQWFSNHLHTLILTHWDLDKTLNRLISKS